VNWKKVVPFVAGIITMIVGIVKFIRGLNRQH
jgi:hypothetical protein